MSDDTVKRPDPVDEVMGRVEETWFMTPPDELKTSATVAQMFSDLAILVGIIKGLRAHRPGAQP